MYSSLSQVPQIIKEISHGIAMSECEKRSMPADLMELLKETDRMSDFEVSTATYGDAAKFFYDIFFGVPQDKDLDPHDAAAIATEFAVLQMRRATGMPENIANALLAEKKIQDSARRTMSRWVEIAYELTRKSKLSVH